MPVSEIIFLLLPIAALSGYVLGRKDQKNRSKRVRKEVSDQYFRGLNYLLSDQEDKAIDLFLKLSEVSEDTIEVHFALANLFKKRGEVDRAIRIHQNLIARPSLDRDYHYQALHELALDYLKAGLFDRAESLFLEVRNKPAHRESSTQHLLEIYQQEKEWEKAIKIAQDLSKLSTKVNIALAHYYCEMAESSLSLMESKMAKGYIKKALSTDRNCARASLLEGNMYYQSNHIQQAINAYQRVEKQDPELLSEIIKPLYLCYKSQRKNFKELVDFYKEILDRHQSISIAIAISNIQFNTETQPDIVEILNNYLTTHASVLSIKYLIEHSHDDHDIKALKPIENVVNRLWTNEIIYLCRNCGLQTKGHHWQCPGCKTWASIKPIHQFEHLSINNK